uniref:Amino acid transporter transmembrane domain-containing protein n=1 Tax=Alexandrium monilatum TaxID=311494 RepID=A0A7S4UCR9_9DINO
MEKAVCAPIAAECDWVREYLPLKSRGRLRSGSCSTRSPSPSQESIRSVPSVAFLEEGLEVAALGRARGSDAGPLCRAVFALASSAMGAGCLSLPFMLRSCGVASGFLMLLLGASLAHLSLTVLMDGAVRTGCSRMAELVAPSGSVGARAFVDMVMATFGISAMLCNLIFAGNFFSGIAHSPLLNLDVSRDRLIAAISAFVVWPLSLGRGKSVLRHVSFLSVAAICLTAVIVACKAPAYAAVRSAATLPEDRELKRWSSDPYTLLQSFSIALFAFNAHANAVPTAHTLARSGGDSRQMVRVSLCSVCVELVVYSLIGIGGYLSFGSTTKQDFILNYPDDDPLMFFVRCISGVAVCLGAPINLSPAASSLTGLLSGKGQAASRSLHVLVVTLAIAGSACVAICSESIADVTGLLGASFATLIVLAWPASVYRRVRLRSHPPRLARCVLGSLGCAALLGFAAFACQVLGH